jgi:hypothetical protein
MGDGLKTLATEIRLSLAGVEGGLHPSTGPGAIRDAQRAEVAAYLWDHPEATPAEVSAALVLPVWSVECRLAELRGLPLPFRTRPGVPTGMTRRGRFGDLRRS